MDFSSCLDKRPLKLTTNRTSVELEFEKPNECSLKPKVSVDNFRMQKIISRYFSCFEGKVHAPNRGDKLTVAPGSTVKLQWSFDANISEVRVRMWMFLRNNNEENRRKGVLGDLLAVIHNNSDPEIYSNLFSFAMEKPATLVLKNVSSSNNGSYGFALSAPGESTDPFYITLFIAGNCTK